MNATRPNPYATRAFRMAEHARKSRARKHTTPARTAWEMRWHHARVCPDSLLNDGFLLDRSSPDPLILNAHRRRCNPFYRDAVRAGKVIGITRRQLP